MRYASKILRGLRPSASLDGRVGFALLLVGGLLSSETLSARDNDQRYSAV